MKNISWQVFFNVHIFRFSVAYKNCSTSLALLDSPHIIIFYVANPLFSIVYQQERHLHVQKMTLGQGYCYYILELFC